MVENTEKLVMTEVEENIRCEIGLLELFSEFVLFFFFLNVFGKSGGRNIG